MSTYAIGDIHGCLSPLEDLIKTLHQEEELNPDRDRLVFVGDYIDRGPKSKEVVEYLLDLKELVPCTFLLGNHEDMMLYYLGVRTHDHQKVNPASLRFTMSIGDYWMRNGGAATTESYGHDILERGHFEVASLPEDHLNFYLNLKYYHIEDSVLFVHAGVSFRALTALTPLNAVELSDAEDLVWDRDAVKHKNHFGTIVYGHTPHEEGVFWNRAPEGEPPYSVGIDIGPVFRDIPLLAAVRIDDWKEIWSG